MENKIKFITKIYRDNITLEPYMKISIQHDNLYDGNWKYETNEHIYYEDRFTKDEYNKLTNGKY